MTVAVIGAGGHTRSLINILKKTFLECEIEIYDDGFVSAGETICGFPILGGPDHIKKNMAVVLSKGDNQVRKDLYHRYSGQVYKSNLIHAAAYIEEDCKIGFSNQIFANAYINSSVIIRDNNIINTAAILEHEVIIGSHNHISVNAVLCGRVELGSECFIGASATVRDKIKICDKVVIGAGSVVVKDIERPGVYVGVPCRKVK